MLDVMERYGSLKSHRFGYDRFTGNAYFTANYKDYSSAFAALDDLEDAPLFGHRVVVTFNRLLYNNDKRRDKTQHGAVANSGNNNSIGDKKIALKEKKIAAKKEMKTLRKDAAAENASLEEEGSPSGERPSEEQDDNSSDDEGSSSSNSDDSSESHSSSSSDSEATEDSGDSSDDDGDLQPR